MKKYYVCKRLDTGQYEQDYMFYDEGQEQPWGPLKFAWYSSDRAEIERYVASAIIDGIDASLVELLDHPHKTE